MLTIRHLNGTLANTEVKIETGKDRVVVGRQLDCDIQYPPEETAVAQFLKLVDDPANQPVYVHCQGGRHRTGVMTAVFRMTEDGWTADHAYAEMKQFNFEGFPGHPTLKQFVFDFYTHIDHSRVAGSQPAVATVAAR